MAEDREAGGAMPRNDSSRNISFQDISWGRVQPRVRDYFAFLARLEPEAIPDGFRREQYGAVTYDGREYPLIRVVSEGWRADRHTILVAGGVHGCEPAGVEGAMLCVRDLLPAYRAHFNFAVYPCLNPTSYEMDTRWNYLKQDMNRNYRPGTAVEECRLFTLSVRALAPVDVVMDLHESLQKDAETMRIQAQDLGNPRAAMWDDIPRGYFIYEDSPQDGNGAWVRIGREIVEAVRPLIPPCSAPDIAGDVSDGGVIYYPQAMSAATSDYIEPYATDSHLRAAGLARHGFTSETPDLSEDGRVFTVEDRAQAHAVAVRAALECVLRPSYPPPCGGLRP